MPEQLTALLEAPGRRKAAPLGALASLPARAAASGPPAGSRRRPSGFSSGSKSYFGRCAHPATTLAHPIAQPVYRDRLQRRERWPAGRRALPAVRPVLLGV